ncbi:MAG: T9SS type A sorting domain-containing protein, partial [Bacteroidia bacterium]|nr:T9SS type A sorting domain-containing protein [Bacteroidia bacterium]
STCSVTLTRPTATDNCTGTVTATTTAPLSYTAQGTYTVNWVYNDGHGNTANQSQTVVVNCVTTGVSETALLQASVYPNPASDVFTVSIPGSNSEYAITLCDQLGKVVLQSTMTAEAALDVKALSSGLYYLNITDRVSGKNTVQKIVVNH